MFNIDRKYIDRPTTEDTLQSRVIYILSKNKNAPTLPKAETYGINAEEFDNYMDKKQELAEWQKYCKQKGLAVMGVLFCIPPVVVNFHTTNSAYFFLSFLAGMVLAAIPWGLFKALSAYREKKLHDERCERYLAAILEWNEDNGLSE